MAQDSVFITKFDYEQVKNTPWEKYNNKVFLERELEILNAGTVYIKRDPWIGYMYPHEVIYIGNIYDAKEMK